MPSIESPIYTIGKGIVVGALLLGANLYASYPDEMRDGPGPDGTILYQDPYNDQPAADCAVDLTIEASDLECITAIRRQKQELHNMLPPTAAPAPAHEQAVHFGAAAVQLASSRSFAILA